MASTHTISGSASTRQRAITRPRVRPARNGAARTATRRPGGVAAPSLGRPVDLRLAPVAAASATSIAMQRRVVPRRDDPVRFTDRGLLAVLIVFATLAAASVIAVVASFVSVSNAPLSAGADHASTSVVHDGGR